MSDYSTAINRQYGKQGLIGRLLSALEEDGRATDSLTLDDLSVFDQMHYGGREATQSLARLAGMRAGMRVLDLGSGLGGPARILAAEFGCTVLGVDLTEAFVEAAAELTARSGLSEQVSFRQGSALDLPFEDEVFDAVWSQNAIMNIEDKAQFFGEAFRVLRPGGVLALATILKGPGPEPVYPLFWANDASVSFLVTQEALRDIVRNAGFEVQVWDEKSDKVRAALDDAPAGPPPSVVRHLVFNVEQKGANTAQGMRDGALGDIWAVLRRGIT